MAFITKGNVNSLIAAQFFLLRSIENESSTNPREGGQDGRTVHLQRVIFTDIKSFRRNNGRAKSSDCR